MIRLQNTRKIPSWQLCRHGNKRHFCDVVQILFGMVYVRWEGLSPLSSDCKQIKTNKQTNKFVQKDRAIICYYCYKFKSVKTYLISRIASCRQIKKKFVSKTKLVLLQTFPLVYVCLLLCFKFVQITNYLSVYLFSLFTI